MKDISYSYENQKNKILKNINMTVMNNEKIAIIGKTGCGKSTLLKIILGLYKPMGEIKVFGKTPRGNEKEIWSKIGYLDNNMYIFEESVKYNITLLNRELKAEEEKKFEEVVKLLKMEKTVVENRNLKQFGSNLSGGQKLKINIARALFRNVELLILDEPVSSLDKDSENILCDILSDIKMTVIIVTHRNKILNICNTVYEVNNNSILKIRDKEEKIYENQV